MTRSQVAGNNTNSKLRRIMKKIFFPMIAALLVAGCAKENPMEPQESQNVVTVLTADMSATKTVLQDDQKVLWTNGDKINVNGVESNALELDAPSASASFTLSGVLSNPYKAVYPASIYKDAQTVTLPAVQTYVEGSFGSDAAPMAAYQAEGNNLNFKHLCAVLKLNIAKGEDADKIAYVEFCGKNNEKVSGDFSINYEDATITAVGTATEDEKTILINVATIIPEEGNLAVYVVVPAIEFANGYTVRVVDAEGHYMEISKKSAQTLKAGTVYDMPEFAFIPTGTIINADVEIKSAEELIAFATKYNAGEYEPTVSAMLMNDIVFDETTSAAFNATGGIGAGDAGSFQGTFYGNNKTIKGLKATLSVFYKLTENGLIKDLTLDETTSFEFTPTNEMVANGNLEIAAIALTSAGQNNEINNVKVASNINILPCAVNLGSNSYSLNVGAIIGRIYYGKIIDCNYSGVISIPKTAQIGSQKKASYVNCGGLCGHVTNAHGIIQSSVFSGTLNFSGDLYGNSHTVRIGGIVGRFGHNTTYNALNGTENKNIINNGTIIVDQADNGANNHTYYIGGIVGESVNNIHNVVNNGKVEVKTTGGKVSNVKLGGIVGNLATKMTVNNCDNKGEVYCNIATSLCAYDAIMAYTTYEEGKGYEDVVKNCTNTGNVHAN